MENRDANRIEGSHKPIRKVHVTNLPWIQCCTHVSFPLYRSARSSKCRAKSVQCQSSFACLRVSPIFPDAFAHCVRKLKGGQRQLVASNAQGRSPKKRTLNQASYIVLVPKRMLDFEVLCWQGAGIVCNRSFASNLFHHARPFSADLSQWCSLNISLSKCSRHCAKINKQSVPLTKVDISRKTAGPEHSKAFRVLWLGIVCFCFPPCLSRLNLDLKLGANIYGCNSALSLHAIPHICVVPLCSHCVGLLAKCVGESFGVMSKNHVVKDGPKSYFHTILSTVCLLRGPWNICQEHVQNRSLFKVHARKVVEKKYAEPSEFLFLQEK